MDLWEGALFLGKASFPPARGSRERCKVPQWASGRSPSRQNFWCTLVTPDELFRWAKLCMQLYHFTCFYHALHVKFMFLYDFKPIKKKAVLSQGNCAMSQLFFSI